jgi:ferric-dicitrate binding protein FerR (iron transport regulator)
MMDAQGGSELRELLGALLNGTLTPLEQARLDRHLSADEGARRYYRRYINLHAALRFHCTALLAPELPPVQGSSRQEGGTPAKDRWPQGSRARSLLALAAGVLFLLGLSWLCGTLSHLAAPEAQQGPVIGTLSSLHGSVRVQGARGARLAKVGMKLHAADTLAVSVDASAVLALQGAIQAELGPETTLMFSGARAKALYLQSGFLAVEAGRQPPGQPLRIVTPDAQAEVLGTKFNVAASSRQTRLRVAEGTVKMWSESADSSVVVPAGFGSGIADGVALPVRPSPLGEVLLIESLDKSRDSGQWAHFNREMASRLLSAHVRRLALQVVIKSHHQVQASDLKGRPLVIVSVSEEKVGFEDNLRRIGLAEARVPVMCLETIALPVLQMTGPKRGLDFEWSMPPKSVRFPRPDHPLSAGQAGMVRLPVTFGWGRPAAEALRIAILDDHPDRAVLFAYDTGEKMMGRKAPARRLGLFLEPTFVDQLDTASWNLFEAAVNWCLEPTGN